MTQRVAIVLETKFVDTRFGSIDDHPVAARCTCRISLHQHSWQCLWCYVQGWMIIHMGAVVYSTLYPPPLHPALDS